MKRMLTAAVVAMALIGGMAQEASAWCKFTFSTGVNIGFETGGWYKKKGNYEKGTYPAPYAGGYGGFGDFGPSSGAPEGPEVLPNCPVPQDKTSGPIQSVGYYTYPGYRYPSHGYNTPTVWWGN